MYRTGTEVVFCVQHKAFFYSCIGNDDIYTWLISFSDLNATASPTAGT